MPLILPDTLPAIELLKHENIFLSNTVNDFQQAHKPLKIVVLNLMPIKITTETDIVRLLSNSSLYIQLYFMKLRSHTPKHTSAEHMQRFYQYFDDFVDQQFDGMIVTGAPIEMMPFEEVGYWKEITQIFDWAQHNVRSSLYLCWASMAALYHFHGVPKHSLPKKKFGIYTQTPLVPTLPIFRGFDDQFKMPQSRHTEIRKEDLNDKPELTLIAESAESGVGIVMEEKGKAFFITGHLEYAPDTLDNEFKRDFGKRDDVALPEHYYLHDNPNENPMVTWRAHANLFYHNWINYYVNQDTDSKTLMK